MNKQTLLPLFLLLLMGLARPWPTLAADAVVGDGTAASCTEAAFDAAFLTANGGGGTITFNCGDSPVTIPFTLVKYANLGNVTLDGGNQITLAAGPNERHFFIGNGVTVTLRGLTLQGGDSLVNGGSLEISSATVLLDGVQLVGNRTAVSGGAIYCYDATLTIQNSRFADNEAVTGGAIFNDGCTLDIAHTTFTANRTGNTGRGGAIENAPLGMLTVRHSHFETNLALDGGGLYNASGATADLAAVTFVENTAGYGGGIENNGTLTLSHSLIDGNQVTGSGGGLWNSGGTATIAQTTFHDNFAYEGGGISSYGTHLELNEVNITSNVANGLGGTPSGGGLHLVSGTANITNATIASNYAATNGGGIYHASDDNLVLTNVTIAGNAAAQLGGGVYHVGRYAVLVNATLANNIASVAGNAIYEDSPMTPSNPGVVQLANSIIFGSANNCDGGLFQSLGHNISQGSCAALADPTDQENVAGDLLLGPLAYNGGSFAMQTMLPQAGSPLIDTADPAQCNATDQRGASRVGTCDIGAVEYGAVAFRIFLPLVVR